MKIEKYHGLGNSFLITEYQENINYKELSIELCDNNSSIGGDGLIIVKTSPLEMVIYNKDGSEAIMCGNGLRCFIHYCFFNGILKERKENIEIKTKSGIYEGSIISINPFFTKIKFKRSLIRKEIIGLYGNSYESYFVKTGVNHNVIVYNKDNINDINLLKDNFIKYGGFSDETNIDLVEKIDERTIKVETYERGVGFTKSCGTGGVASALVSNYLFDCSNDIDVVNEYGKLNISIEGNHVYMIGPSKRIFSMEYTND
jgi:diaminopimelate epimerase